VYPVESLKAHFQFVLTAATACLLSTLGILILLLRWNHLNLICLMRTQYFCCWV